MSDKKQFPPLLSSSPHSFIPVDARKVMIVVILSLLPASVYGVVIFGTGALFTILASIVAAVVSELVFQLATKQKPRIADCSAVVTGLLLALILPPSTPLWMTALGSVFAIVVAKEFFGGLGQNPFNPALSGRAFLLMSFPAAITTWHKPFQALVDTSTTATPLNVLRQTGDLMKAAESAGASNLSDFYMMLFMGNRAGSIGETSILLVLLGGLFLALVRVIDLRTPVSLIAATALSGWALGIDPLFSVLSGGVVFGAFFMATDYSSGPITPNGKIVFGLACGCIISIIRKFGAFPEGVTYAILIMNTLVPFLDKLTVRKYGFVKPAKPRSGKGA